MTNPFTPTFGVIPAHMAGREHIISELIRALEAGPGDPGLTTILTGARGTGKTALLSYLADEASSRGWVAVNVSALPGMLDEILQQTLKHSSHLIERRGALKLAAIKVADLAEIQFQSADNDHPTWRIGMEEALDKLAETDAGLLITVDEVREDLDEMVQLASVFQHFVRDRRRVALFMAGLPTHVSGLLQNKSVSFLRRANFHELGVVSDFDIEQAMRKTIEDGGRGVSPEALSRAVQLTEGFPYMMQLVGYRAWNESPERNDVTLEDVDSGGLYARNDLQRKVFDTTFCELSKGDVRFLAAMLDDEGPSALADIASVWKRRATTPRNTKSVSWSKASLSTTAKERCASPCPCSKTIFGKDWGNRTGRPRTRPIFSAQHKSQPQGGKAAGFGLGVLRGCEMIRRRLMPDSCGHCCDRRP